MLHNRSPFAILFFRPLFFAASLKASMIFDFFFFLFSFGIDACSHVFSSTGFFPFSLMSFAPAPQGPLVPHTFQTSFPRRLLWAYFHVFQKDLLHFFLVKLIDRKSLPPPHLILFFPSEPKGKGKFSSLFFFVPLSSPFSINLPCNWGSSPVCSSAPSPKKVL